MLTQLQIRDIRSLEVFAEVVDAGGITAAQERLGMTQSNISAQLLDLEARLGMKLCERGRAGFRVTEEGAEVYATTQLLLADLGDYQDRLQSIGRGLRGELLIGHMDHYLSHPEAKLVPALKRMTDLSQDIYFNLRTATVGDLQHCLETSDLQLAIGTFSNFIQGVDYHALHEEQQILCCAAEHSLASKSRLSKQEAASAGYAKATYAYGKEEGVLENCTATVHHLEGMVAFILSGRGVGYLPDHVARAYLDTGQMVELMPQAFRVDLTVYLAVRQKSLASPLVRRFTDALLEL